MPPNKRRKLDPAPKPWQEVAKEAQDLRDGSLSRVPEAPESSKFPRELPKNSIYLPQKLLHTADSQITEMLPDELVNSLASGTLSAVDVTTAFLRRAVVAQKLVNPKPLVLKTGLLTYELDKLHHRVAPRTSSPTSPRPRRLLH